MPNLHLGYWKFFLVSIEFIWLPKLLQLFNELIGLNEWRRWIIKRISLLVICFIIWEDSIINCLIYSSRVASTIGWTTYVLAWGACFMLVEWFNCWECVIINTRVVMNNIRFLSRFWGFFSTITYHIKNINSNNTRNSINNL